MRAATALMGGVLACAPVAQAQDATISFNSYGSPGLIDMPTGESAPDGQLTTTLSHVAGTTRATLNFQISPRLSGSFRYVGIHDFNHPASVDGVYYDRSFDLRYQLLNEGRYVPSVVVGLQDFAGTGLYGGEYIAATKTLAPGLKLTGGLGWGRFGSSDAFATTGTRPTQFLGEGGVPSYDQWFRGDVAAFGGLSYAPNDKLRFSLEYSTDNYTEEQSRAGFKRNSPWNVGVDYTLKSGTQLSLYHTYGSTFGAQITIVTDPKKAAAPGGAGPGPQPVGVRSAAQRRDLGWSTNPNVAPAIEKTLSGALLKEGLQLEGLEVTGSTAHVRIQNNRYPQAAQAIGRTARVMSRLLPGSIERFTIVPTQNGLPMSAIEMNRSDIETYEHRDSAEILARTQIVDAVGNTPSYSKELYPRFTWSVAPTVAYSIFDPDEPVRADLRLRLKSAFEMTPNLVLSGAVSQKLAGNIDQVTRPSNSVLPRVRTDVDKYSQEGQFALDYLTLAHFGRPAKDFYSRVTVGYLEQMYAGVSGEVLWKPVNSRLALGLELNYVQQRAYDQGFGLRDYNILTGHASAYYSFGKGYHAQLDVGRYLAGDYGATISLDREFSNGWRVGAFATFTDVSAEDFGEGSFDKGIRISVPLATLTGQPSQHTPTFDLRPIQRDGGARLNVQGRLYDQVRTYHEPDVAKTWGKFWK